jgi:hypothetical protein
MEIVKSVMSRAVVLTLSKAGLLVEFFFEEEALREHAEDVLQGEVGFLDVHRDGGGDDDVVVAEVSHLAAS